MFVFLCKKLALNQKNDATLSVIRCLSSSARKHPQTPEISDSFFSFFRDNGFSDTQISTAVTKHPRLLKSNLQKNILPKIEFLRSVGVSNKHLPELIIKSPCYLTRSLKKHTIPCYDTLKSILLSDDEAISLLGKLSSYDSSGVKTNLAVNVSLLRKLRMPEHFISMFLSQNHRILCMNVDKFSVAVEKTVGMGFNPLTYTFARAVQVHLQMSPKTWEAKLNVFRKWGLSEDQFWSTFRMNPLFMMLSGETMAKKMDFLVNKMDFQPDAVIRYPTALCYNLGKRIVPRCSVLKILSVKGLMKEELSLDTVLAMSTEKFLNRFVKKHVQEVPELMDVLQGKMDLEKYGFGFNEKRSVSVV